MKTPKTLIINRWRDMENIEMEGPTFVPGTLAHSCMSASKTYVIYGEEYLAAARAACFTGTKDCPTDVVISVDLANYNRVTGLARMEEVAALRGLKLVKRRVYKTARKWYTIARPIAAACRYGHPMTTTNSYTNADNQIVCRTCHISYSIDKAKRRESTYTAGNEISPLGELP